MQWKTYGGRRFHLHLTGYWISSKPRPQISLHRFVWQEAHGPIPDGYHIHHRDHDPGNNALENLELIEGRAHISRHHKGRKALCGEQTYNHKLTDEQVLEIRASYTRQRNGGQQALADKYGVSKTEISLIIRGKRWAHLPVQPKAPPPTSCVNGHPYTPENTRVARAGYRYCLTCHQAVQKITGKRQAAKEKEARALARAARLAAKEATPKF